LNVLLIVADDLRDTVGCYGNTQIKTPNMDRLAQRGVRFDRAYAQYPVCNPSRTPFLTGLRCEQTGVTGNTAFFRIKLPDIVTLPQLLRRQGWYAASYGKICHIGEAMGEARESLRPLLENPTTKGRDAAFTLGTCGGNRYGPAVRTDRWRFILWSDGHTELYDEQNDPQETRDLSKKPEHTAPIQHLKGQLVKTGPPMNDVTQPAKPANRKSATQSRT